ncbi:Fc receptor-like protein 4, partial [Neolamprologus brichardi]|uniref:Fc receptor-like protein 4 n=1 Tax=Neolamprologus brichardi TaxID=32507 RepID=UPI001643D76A
AVLTIEPSWSSYFIGESVTFKCDMNEGKDTDWYYTINKDGREYAPYRDNKDYTFEISSTDRSGVHFVRFFFISADKPRATLTAGKTIIPVGGSVTLTCSVQSSDGWKYEWFRHKPKAKLRADNTAVPVGGSVTLTCSVNPSSSSSGWKYYWYRDEKSSEALTTQDVVFHSNGQISVSQEGLYRCRGGRGNPVYYTEDSQSVRIWKTVSNRPVVTLYPNWSEIYRGETITVRCEIHGGDTEWDYEWETNSMIKAPNQNKYRIRSASSSNSGNYRCKGRMKSSQHKTTEWSDSVTLTVSDSKGDPEYHTDHSQPKFVWSADVHSAASLTVSPDRVQHFTSDSVSLTCEGNFTEGRVRKFSEDGRLYSVCRRMTGSTCDINTSKSDTGVYWCESGSGEFSSAVNITVQNDGNGPILVSPVHPVTEGASVSLSCSLRTQKILSNVFFFHNDKLLQNDTRGELKISAVSKSDEGFYKCQYSGRESAQSWMSVKGEQDQNI